MSKKYTLNKEDIKRIATGAGVATLGALLTYLNAVVMDTDFIISGVDYTPVVVALWSVIVNTARKYTQGD